MTIEEIEEALTLKNRDIINVLEKQDWLTSVVQAQLADNIFSLNRIPVELPLSYQIPYIEDCECLFCAAKRTNNDRR